MAMEKVFDHKIVENKIYEEWEKNGAFQPKAGAKPFTILMPHQMPMPRHAGHGMYTVTSSSDGEG